MTQVEPFDVVSDPEGLRHALAGAGLSAPSAHARLGEEDERTFEAAATVGASTVVHPYTAPERWSSAEQVDAVAGELARAADAARAYGLRIGYHNHHWELRAGSTAGRRSSSWRSGCRPASCSSWTPTGRPWAARTCRLCSAGSAIASAAAPQGRPGRRGHEGAGRARRGRDAGRRDRRGRCGGGARGSGVRRLRGRPVRRARGRASVRERAGGAVSGAGPVGVGVIGAGTISDQYLPNMASYPDLAVRFVADLRPERARGRPSVRRPRPGCPDEALARDDVELIVNLTDPGRARRGRRGRARRRQARLQREADRRRPRVGRGAARSRPTPPACGSAARPTRSSAPGCRRRRRLIERGAIGKPLTASAVFQNAGPAPLAPEPGLPLPARRGAAVRPRPLLPHRARPGLRPRRARRGPRRRRRADQDHRNRTTRGRGGPSRCRPMSRPSTTSRPAAWPRRRSASTRGSTGRGSSRSRGRRRP